MSQIHTPIQESNEYSEYIREIQTGDRVIGGREGPINQSLAQLANRTKWLKEQLSTQQTALNSKLEASRLVSATTARAGMVQLSSAVNSTAETKAATEKAVKTAYDKAIEALNAANAHTHSMSQITDFDLRDLGGNDLDSVKKAGFYRQPTSNEAKTERHYPEQMAGSLQVMPSVNGWKQIYITYDQSKIYARNNINGGDWGSWKRVDGGDAAPKVHSHSIQQITGLEAALAAKVNTADFTQNLNENGWAKLPNGLIMQWGVTPVIGDERSVDVVFPIAFPNKVLSIQLTENNGATWHGNASHVAARNASNTKFNYWHNSTLAVNTQCYWLAIGC